MATPGTSIYIRLQLPFIRNVQCCICLRIDDSTFHEISFIAKWVGIIKKITPKKTPVAFITTGVYNILMTSL